VVQLPRLRVGKIASGLAVRDRIKKTTVERLAPGGEWLWDDVVKGFGARRQVDGVFYYLRYRVNGSQRFKSIGRHGSPFTPDTARTEAKQLLGLVAAGIDPLEEDKRTRLKGAAVDTFGRELERYLDRKRQTMKPLSYWQVELHLRKHAKPLHRLRLTDIDRRTIASRLAEIETGSGRVSRNRVRSSLSAFFVHCVKEGLLDLNPVAGTAKADEGRSRDRVLSDAELTAIWQALGADQFSDIVRLLTLTAQRREEIGGLRWSEVDFERGLIVLPPDRTKNRREHAVPLSPQARAIIERQPRGREFVFGHGAGGFSGWSRCKERLDQRVKLPAWRLHDLRRTAATVMADRLGVLPHIIEAVLNHVSGHRAGVAGVYNRAKYAAEMREALQRWADHIEIIRR
jgi:integrase